MNEPIRVGVGATDGSFGASLCAYLGSYADNIVHGPYQLADALSEAVAADKLDLVVVDIEFWNDCCELEPGLPVASLVLGPTDADQMIRAFSQGASSYLDEDASFEEIAVAVETLADGHAVVPPALLGALLKHVVQRQRLESSARQRLERLTRREREVFELMATGADNAKIASQLYISPATVRTHCERVFKKLRVHSRAEAVHFAVQCGIYPGTGVREWGGTHEQT